MVVDKEEIQDRYWIGYQDGKATGHTCGYHEGVEAGIKYGVFGVFTIGFIIFMVIVNVL